MDPVERMKEISERIEEALKKNDCSKCGRVRIGRCCCNRCASSRGYFCNPKQGNRGRFEYSSGLGDHCWSGEKHTLSCLPLELINLFDKEKGFLGDYGCRLPRHLRSAVCLDYLCDDLKLIPELHGLVTEMVYVRKQAGFPW